MGSVFLIVYAVFILFICAIAYVIKSIGIMGCLKKAGEKQGKAWIPVFNNYYLYKIIGMKGGLIALNIIQIIICIIMIGSMVGMFSSMISETESQVNNTSYNYTRNYTNSNYTNTKNSNRTKAVDILDEIDEDTDSDEDFNVRENGVAMVIFLMVFIISYFIAIALSIAMFVIRVFIAINVSKSFGLGGGTIAGMILIPEIFLLIVAYGNSKYVGDYKKSEIVEA